MYASTYRLNLPPCPRCGGVGKVEQCNNDLIAGITVTCEDCGAQTYGFKDKSGALRAWQKGYVDTYENRMRRRREAEMRVWRMVSPEPELKTICEQCHYRPKGEW